MTATAVDISDDFLHILSEVLIMTSYELLTLRRLNVHTSIQHHRPVSSEVFVSPSCICVPLTSVVENKLNIPIILRYIPIFMQLS